MSLHTEPVAEKNVERLLGAYRPEAVDPGFVAETRDKLLSAARDLAAARAPAERSPRADADPGLVRLRRRLGWAMALAASLAAVFLVHRASQPRPAAGINAQKPSAPSVDPETPPSFDTTFGLTPRPRPAAKPVAPTRAGETLTTNAGERRRVVLEDGSVLYVNQNTQVRVSAPRKLDLSRGEVYIEVAPRDSGERETFQVHTPSRTVSALGTRFRVHANPKGAGVLVTQGKVKVSDLDQPLITGQQLITGSTRIAAAPRATHELDWTKELMAAAESPLVPGPGNGGGALIAIDPSGQEVRLTLRRYHIDVHIEDGFARTTIDQTYFNNEISRLEGTFYFPLPPDASLSRLAMYVEDGDESKLNEGGMAERQHARNVYEEILHQRRDPALLEWVDGSTFKMRVFPLEGRKEKRILLSYTQRLSALYGIQRYRFPAGQNMELVREWSFAGRVRHGAESRITSPSHPDMSVMPKGGDMLLAAAARPFAGEKGKAEKDLVLEIIDREAEGDAPRWNSAVHENFHYLMLRLRPELAAQSTLQRRDWVILFESGANRDPLLARTQIDVVRHLLENAEHDDTFAILTANTRVHLFDRTPRPATKKNVDEAVAWLEASHLIGALDLNQALEAATPLLKLGKNPHLVHIGAATPALGERGDDVLAKRVPEGTRYVGIGVGKRWNRAFMKMTAERTGGYFTQINPDEPVMWKTFELMATLNTPRLMDVKLQDAAGKANFLTDTLALAEGEEICAIARVESRAASVGDGKSDLPETVLLTGKLDGKDYRRVFNVTKPRPGADYLPRTWAKLEIDRLLADGAEKHKEAITRLSMAMYVMSPFTSLLVLETEEDYRKFNVDRGRKDHWALYPAPDRIPTVFEPDPERQAWLLKGDKDGRQPAEKVLASILVRPAPRCLRLPGEGGGVSSPQVTALDLYRGSQPAPALAAHQVWSATEFLGSNELGVEFGLQNPVLFERLARDGKVFFEAGDKLVLRPDSYRLRLESKPEPSADHFRFAPRSPALGALGRKASGRKHDLPPMLLLRSDLKKEDELAFFPPALGQVASESKRPHTALTGGVIGGKDKAPGRFRGSSPFVATYANPMAGGLYSIDGRVQYAPLSVGRIVLLGNDVDLGRTPEKTLRPIDVVHFGLDGLDFAAERLRERIGDEIHGERGEKARSRELRLSELIALEAEPLRLVTARGLLGESGKAGRHSVLASALDARAGLPISAIEDAFFALPKGGEAAMKPARKDVADFLAAGTLGESVGRRLLFARAHFVADNRLFTDLAIYAPGLQTTWADIAWTLDREAIPDQEAVPSGSVDDRARALIDRARAAGWEEVAFPGGFKALCDGSGRLRYTSTLNTGLDEEVVCDGEHLWHLYRDLGLAGRRPFSRHHAGQVQSLIPWFLPPAEWLSHGADVVLVEENVVAIVPRTVKKPSPDKAADKAAENEAPARNRQLRLVFAGDRLAEHRVVEVATGRILLRQTYSAEGVCRLFDENNRMLAETRLARTPAAAPELAPDLSGLLVMRFPIRTTRHRLEKTPYSYHRYGAISQALAEDIFVSQCLEHDRDWSLRLFAERFHSRGDRRIGFYVLLNAIGVPIRSDHVYTWQGEATTETRGDKVFTYHEQIQGKFNVVLEHPDKPLARYLEHNQRLMAGSKAALWNLPGPTDSFVSRLAACRDLVEAWRNNRVGRVDGERFLWNGARTLAFLRDCPDERWAWAVTESALYSPVWQGTPTARPDDERSFTAADVKLGLAEVGYILGARAGLGYANAYVYAGHLFAAGRKQEAKAIFRALDAAAFHAGGLAPIDHVFQAALNDGAVEGSQPFAERLRQKHAILLKEKRPLSALALAWQAHQLGDRSLAGEFLQATIDRAAEEDRNLVRLAAVQFLAHTGQHAYASTLLEAALQDPVIRERPIVWRLAARLAEQRGLLAKSVAATETALDLEYRSLPEVINLQAVRQDYGALLGQYEQMSQVFMLTKTEAPKELIAKVVRTADRWRGLDPDNMDVPARAATLLQVLGVRDLAWDYLTTPLGMKPGESEPWLALARRLVDQAEFELADRAYAAAYRAEPTNAEILWSRALNLQTMGRMDQARAVHRQIAEGTWQPRFAWIVEQAREAR